MVLMSEGLMGACSEEGTQSVTQQQRRRLGPASPGLRPHCKHLEVHVCITKVWQILLLQMQHGCRLPMPVKCQGSRARHSTALCHALAQQTPVLPGSEHHV